MKKPKREDAKKVRDEASKAADSAAAPSEAVAPPEMPDPFTAMEKAFDKPEAIEALVKLRDMFKLAAAAAQGDDAALRKVARNNLGPDASDAQVRALVAQLRDSLRKR